MPAPGLSPEPLPGPTMLVQLSVADLRAIVAEAVAEALDERGGRDPLLALPRIKEGYGLGRASILGAVSRGELAATRGARNAILVRQSELERWLGTRPVVPSPRPLHEPEPSLDDWEQRAEQALLRASKAA